MATQKNGKPAAKKSATAAKSNTRPKGSKASPSPAPGDSGPVRGESAPKEELTDKNMGTDARRSSAEADTAADGRPRTRAGVKAVIHPNPHERWASHPAGEDADPDAKPNENNEQILYGLKQAGRLYAVRHPDRPMVMVEADTEEDAREGYQCEMEHRGETEKKKATETPARVQLVDPKPEPAEFRTENIRVRKLSP